MDTFRVTVIRDGHLKKPEQRQDSLRDQMVDVVTLAELAGCYDAADFLKNNFDLWRGNEFVEGQSKVSGDGSSDVLARR